MIHVITINCQFGRNYRNKHTFLRSCENIHKTARVDVICILEEVNKDAEMLPRLKEEVFIKRMEEHGYLPITPHTIYVKNKENFLYPDFGEYNTGYVKPYTLL